MRRTLIRLLLVVLVLGALVTGGIVANVVLLGYADSRHDPVGRLTPRAVVTRHAAPAQPRVDSDEHTRGDDDTREAEEPDD